MYLILRGKQFPISGISNLIIVPAQRMLSVGMQYLEFLFIREINKQSKDKEIFCYAEYLLKYFLGRKLLTTNNLTVMIFLKLKDPKDPFEHFVLLRSEHD